MRQEYEDWETFQSQGVSPFICFMQLKTFIVSLKTEIKLIKANDFVIKFVPWHFNQILFILKV